MPLLDQWRVWQEAQGLSPRTITERIAVLNHLARYTNAHLDQLAPEQIVTFTARRDISQAARATYHTSIRAFCAWMIAAGHRDDDPSTRTPRPKRPKGQPRPLAAIDVRHLLAAANRKRTRTYIILAAFAGLRVHEIAKIHGDDLHHGILTVTGKGGKTAMIPAHERILAEADDYPTDDYWFPSYTRPGPVDPHAVSKGIRDAMRRAGIHNGKPHQLRHFYATALLDSGTDLRVVQTLMRHESPATTAIYTKVDFDRQVEGINRLAA